MKTISLFVCALLLLSFAAKAAINVDQSSVEELPSNEIQMLKCTVNDSALSILSLQEKKFISYHSDAVTNDEQAFWLKITINNLSDSKNYYLCTSLFDYLKTCYVDSNQNLLCAKSGMLLDHDQKSTILGSNSFLPIELHKGSNDIYIFAYKIERSKLQYAPVPLTIYSNKSFNEMEKNSSFFLHFFLGAIIIMTIYNMALFLIVKRSFYLLYMAHNLAILFFVLAQTGILELKFTNSFAHHEMLVVILGNIAFTFYMLFTKSILNFKKWDPLWNSRVKKGLVVWTLLNIIVPFNIEIAVILGSIGAIVGYFIVIYSSVKAARKGSIPAKYFLIGNIVYYVTLFTSILQINGLVPHLIFGMSSVEIIEIGTMIELALFSLTLGSTINYMRDKLSKKELEQIRLKEENQKKYSDLIEQKNQELEQKVKERTRELSESAKIIERKNNDIMDSMSYARRIQNALLPDQELWKSALPNSFIFYKPKEIISGDFYWLNGSTQGDTLFFAACDCTGHGVPGAMVSVVGYNNLNRCINEFKLVKPSDILNRLNLLVEESFEMGGRSKGEINDGMDIALCAINYVVNHQPNSPKAKIQFSAANSPLWLIRKGQCKVPSSDKVSTYSHNGYCLIAVSPNKQPIGRFRDRTPFENHELELYENDQLYIFSDGYADQFGGPKGKKFKQKQLKNFLISIQELSPEEQKNKLQQGFEEWRGSEEQVDDICIIGIRI